MISLLPKQTLVIVSTIAVILGAFILGSIIGNFLGQKEKHNRRRETSNRVLSQMQQLNVGDTLPNYRFEALGGDSVWLKELFSRKTVLIISVPQCDDCHYEAQELKLALKDSSDAKFFIMASWENPRLLEEFKEDYKLPCVFIYDHKRKYFSQFEVSAFPLNITLDQNGTILDLLIGSMVKEDFEEIIKFNKQAENTLN